MRTLRLSQIAGAVEGELRGNDVEISSAVVDGRTAAPGGLFVAIRGERTDGHDFLEQAFAAGASAALVARPVGNHPHVLVEDTTDAFLALAASERRAMEGSVVAITGANGKTSTKDL
ncbi:MAG: Mur ligase domain-containing protein, partial [Actinomycetota bacterium]